MITLIIILFISFLIVSAIALDAYGIIRMQDDTIRNYEELIFKMEEGNEV